jgi:TonB family protein
MQGLQESKVMPEYPADARNEHVEGIVLLKINVDREGNVYKTELVSGDPMLAESAANAVRQWKYRPYRLNGQPVEVESTVRVNYALER